MSTLITGVVTNGVIVTNPPLPEGTKVEVIVLPPQTASLRQTSMLEFLKSLPPGPRAFPTWEEYEQHLQAEKNAWDR